MNGGVAMQGGEEHLAMTKRYDGPERVSIEWVTPHQAGEWLLALEQSRERGERKQRSLKTRAVESFIGKLRAGAMGLSWDALAISNDGIPINGQQRLTASHESGIGFWAVVMRNADIMLGGDRGTPRSNGDVLGYTGASNVERSASLVRVLCHIEDGCSSGASRPSEERVADVYRRYEKQILWAVPLFNAQGALRKSAIIGALVFVRTRSITTSSGVAERMVLGLGCERGQPSTTARAFLQGDMKLPFANQVNLALWAAWWEHRGEQRKSVNGYNTNQWAKNWGALPFMDHPTVRRFGGDE